MTRRRTTAASAVALVEEVLGVPLPVRVRLWDGSEAGATDPTAPTVVVRDRSALRHVLWSPGELGLARAYVSGALDVEGDLADGFRRLWAAGRDAGTTETPGPRRPGVRTVARAVGLALRTRAIGPRPPIPASESRLDGEQHTRERDQAAISHHYDLSNAFYALLLDSRMTYSSGFWTQPPGPAYGLEESQADKLDLVCRKLGLEPGMRMLDIGCGWGSLTLHAAEHYGVHVTGVTLSVEQRAEVAERAAARGLADRVDVRVQHYADLDVEPVDAIASLEMGEHVGDDEYVHFAASLHRLLRPGGRVLVQQMSRVRGDSPGGGPFIETYIAPDMHMKPLATTIGLLAGSGLEIRDVQAMREHYPLTVQAWWDRLEQRWDEAVALMGEENARVWRLYLVGGMLAFEENRMGVDQILAVRPSDAGVADMPLSPLDWLAPR